MAIKKICVVTGTRADYGLLYWLMKGLHGDAATQLQIIATAMHLSPEFGLTYKTIEGDGFIIDEKVAMLLSGDSAASITKSMGLGMIGFADALQRLQPDAIVILGDRFEALAAAQAAMLARIPIIHLHGGEATEGLIDESIRHSITKMSHLHFVATEQYRNRVIQLGEQPSTVFNYGAPGIENIKRLNLYDKAELETSLGFSLAETNFMVTYHPVTLSDEAPSRSMQRLLDALDAFPEARVIITYPNADTSGREIISLIKEYGARWGDRVYVTTSLGQIGYLSALKYMSVVIGNSSSGIIEAPSFATPTVNIGSRQRGRIQAPSVIQCDGDEQSIVLAIEKSLDPIFIESLGSMSLPYGDGNTSSKVIEKIKSTELSNILMKSFFNIGYSV